MPRIGSTLASLLIVLSAIGLTQLVTPSGIATADAAPAATPPDPEAQKRGQILFEQSEGAYKEGRFEEAISLLKEAYRLTPDPVVFYNLARAYEAKGDLLEAANAFDRYLAEVKDIPDRGAIERKSKTLRTQLQERDELRRQKEADKPIKPVGPAPDTTARGPAALPWVIAGAGAAAIVAGGVVGALALAKNDEAEVAVSQQETAELRSSAESMALASTITMAVGGAVLAAGAIWGIIDVVGSTKSASDAPTPATAFRLRVGPTGASLSLPF